MKILLRKNVPCFVNLRKKFPRKVTITFFLNLVHFKSQCFLRVWNRSKKVLEIHVPRIYSKKPQKNKQTNLPCPKKNRNKLRVEFLKFKWVSGYFWPNLLLFPSNIKFNAGIFTSHNNKVKQKIWLSQKICHILHQKSYFVETNSKSKWKLIYRKKFHTWNKKVVKALQNLNKWQERFSLQHTFWRLS